MVLSDDELFEALETGQLKIEPQPTLDMVKPSSVDLRLGSQLLEQRSKVVQGIIVDLSTVDVMDHIRAYGTPVDISTSTGYEMHPGTLVLGTTLERLEIPLDLAARVEGKSSLARMGLAVHITAPKIDPGFRGQLTLEMYNLGPFILRLKEGMNICALIVERLGRPARQGYMGLYQT